MEFDGEGKFAAWVTGAENPGKWYDIDTPDVIKYYLDGQRIDSIYRMQSCYAAGDRVNTYDGTSIKYNAVPKWTLFTAHCVAQPIFALFTRKIEGSDMLSLRIHLFNDVIEVTPTESKPIIMINDEPYESFNDTTMPDHLWSEVEDDYIYMTMRRIPVLVFFSNKYLEVTTTYDVAGWTCGMCGDYNQWPETSFNFPGPDGKPINLEDVSRIYTLP
ncbi:hypothetical protein B566_EDAN011937 [Ephemera danica]|nr:hypothetical protein B566_EDAN011937 [Ephemera danica]